MTLPYGTLYSMGRSSLKHCSILSDICQSVMLPSLPNVPLYVATVEQRLSNIFARFRKITITFLSYTN